MRCMPAGEVTQVSAHLSVEGPGGHDRGALGVVGHAHEAAGSGGKGGEEVKRVSVHSCMEGDGVCSCAEAGLHRC
jgi:hypothetical protein